MRVWLLVILVERWRSSRSGYGLLLPDRAVENLTRLNVRWPQVGVGGLSLSGALTVLPRNGRLSIAAFKVFFSCKMILAISPAPCRALAYSSHPLKYNEAGSPATPASPPPA